MRWAGIVGLLSLLVVGGPVAAAPSLAAANLPATVTLDDVLSLLETRSPRAAAERASVAVVAADRVTAQTLPNPTLSYSGLQLVDGTNTGAASANQVVLEQPLLIFGQRGVRTEAADLRTAAEQARVASALSELRLKVRQAFTTLLARQDELGVLEDSLAELTRVQTIVRGRAAAGDRSRYDVMRIEVQTRTLQVEVANLHTDITDAAGQLAALLGAPGWQPRASGSLKPGDVPTEVDQLWETAQRRRPALVAAQRQQAAAYGGITQARREALPIPALAAGALVTNDVYSTSAYFGLSLPLPLFDRNQGAVARATAEANAETLALQAEEAEARAEIERAAAVLRERRATLATLESDVAQRVPELRRMAEDAYREGSGGILELLDAFGSLKDIRLRELQQQEAARLAEDEVIAAAGLDLPDMDSAVPPPAPDAGRPS
ncbi:MAG: TolC family protein [Deltaproteobacteria bacterium]|nr:TolC family protein [Deltaproteobacteria bacterium]